MKPWLRWTLIAVFILIFLFCAILLIDYFGKSGKEQAEFSELSNLVQQATPTEPAPVPTGPADPDTTVPPTDPPSPWVEVTDPKTGETVQVLPEYAPIYELNSDVVGWMRIEGTKVDYPVMQTPDRKDYYLKRNFSKQYSGHGCLYAREECDLTRPSDNITIYGHHMKDGSMFAVLSKYRNGGLDFYDEHRYITFDTLTEHHTYEIFAVFATTATIGEGFAYHDYIDCTEDEFNEFVRLCKKLSFYDTGVTASYGDKLITLSTCEYTRVNGRLVVVAKRIS